MTTLKPHPLAEDIPLPSDQDYLELKKGIEASGQREPIILYEGQILDGRNRYRACKELGLTPVTRQYDPAKDGPSPKALVLDLNLRRRHLTVAQKAAIAVALLQAQEAEPVVSADARPKKKLTVKEAAEVAGVSPRTLEYARAAVDADPAALDKMKKGEEPLTRTAKKVREAANAADKAKQSREEYLESHKDLMSKPFFKAAKEAKVLPEISAAKLWLRSDLTPEERIRREPILLAGLPVRTALKFDELPLDGTQIMTIFMLAALLGENQVYETEIKTGPMSAKGVRYRVRIEAYTKAK